MDDNITRIGRRTPRHDDGRTLVSVPRSECGHPRFIVDEKKAEVECSECGERLNPIWVLRQIATKESILYERRRVLQTLVRQLAEKVRYKCRHCGKMNDMSRIVKIKR